MAVHEVSFPITDEAEILNLGVLPDRRRRGIGRALVGTLLAALARQGAKAAFLEVRASNTAAQGLYQYFGFQPVGRRSRYYDHPTEDAIILRAAISAGERRALDGSKWRIFD